MGPSHGMGEMAVAQEAPMAAATSGEQSGSTLMTVQTMETSLRMSFGNSGRMGRSMQRLVRMACSDGRLSRLWNEPGTRPTEYIFSSKSTESGKKSTPSRGLSAMVTLQRTAVSPYRTMTDDVAS